MARTLHHSADGPLDDGSSSNAIIISKNSINHYNKLHSISVLDLDGLLDDLILPRLPAKVIFKLRIVDKSWNEMIQERVQDENFVDNQTTLFVDLSGFFFQYPSEPIGFLSLDQAIFGVPDPTLSFLPKEVDLRCSYDGILCVQEINGNTYYICNPATKQFRMVLHPAVEEDSETAIAIGPDPAEMGHFLLVCAVLEDNPFRVRFDTFFTTLDEWKDQGHTSNLDAVGLEGTGVLVNGIAYWQSWSGQVLGYRVNDRVAEFYYLPLPLGERVRGVLVNLDGRRLGYLVLEEEGLTFSIKQYEIDATSMDDDRFMSRDSSEYDMATEF